MTIIEWEDKYVIGFDEIDNQHKKMFKIINNLIKMPDDSPRDEIAFVIEELEDYAKTHFYTEEKYMRLYNYTGFYEQQKEHDQFIYKVNEFKDLFADNKCLKDDILLFLINWLTDHIISSDCAFGTFLKEEAMNK